MKPYDLSQYMFRVSQPSGAGRMGYSQTESYAAGTVGEAIKNLAAGGGGGSGGGSGVVTTSYVYNNNLGEAPAVGEIRFDTAPPNTATTMKVHQTTTDDVDVGLAYSYLAAGQRVYIQDADDASRFLKATVVGTPADMGTWWSFPILVTEATVPSLLMERVTIGWPTSAAAGSGIPVNVVPKSAGAGGLVASQIFDGGVNVGVGTGTPGAKLHVAGTVRVDDSLGVGAAPIAGVKTDSHGTFRVQYGGSGEVRIEPGAAEYTGLMSFNAPGGTRLGYIGFMPVAAGAGSAISYVNENGGAHSFVGAIATNGNFNAAGNGVVNGNFTVLGSLANEVLSVANGPTAGELASFSTNAARGAGNGFFSFYDTTGRKSYIGYGASSDTFYVNNHSGTGMIISTPGDMVLGADNVTTTQRLIVGGNLDVGSSINVTNEAQLGYLVALNTGAGGTTSIHFKEAGTIKANVFYHPPTSTFYTDAGKHLFRTTAGEELVTMQPGMISLNTNATIVGTLNVGVGTNAAVVHVHAADGVYTFGSNGATKGMRIRHVADGTYIEGVDQTINTSYQPIKLSGSAVHLSNPNNGKYLAVTSDIYTNCDYYGGNTVNADVTIRAKTLDSGGASLERGGATVTGFLALWNAAGNRQAYIGNVVTTGISSIMYINENGGSHVFNMHVVPQADGTQWCGIAGQRWYAIAAVTGTIQTSDAREKNWLGPPDAAAIRAAGRIIDELGFYTWNTGIDDKIHFGVRAQDVLRILMEEGLEDKQDIDFDRTKKLKKVPKFRHAMIHFETWDEQVTEYAPREDGTADEPTVIPAGNRFGINMSSLAVFLTTAQHARLNAQERRIAHLESHIHGEPEPRDER